MDPTSFEVELEYNSYHITSKLMDTSNYPDTISNYFFTSNYTVQSIRPTHCTVNKAYTCCSNYPDSTTYIASYFFNYAGGGPGPVLLECDKHGTPDTTLAR